MKLAVAGRSLGGACLKLEYCCYCDELRTGVIKASCLLCMAARLDCCMSLLVVLVRVFTILVGLDRVAEEIFIVPYAVC